MLIALLIAYCLWGWIGVGVWAVSLFAACFAAGFFYVGQAVREYRYLGVQLDRLQVPKSPRKAQP